MRMRTEFCAISLLRFNQLRNFSLMRVTGNFRGANRETYRDYRETDRTFRETAEKPSTATDGASDFDSSASQATATKDGDR